MIAAEHTESFVPAFSRIECASGLCRYSPLELVIERHVAGVHVVEPTSESEPVLASFMLDLVALAGADENGLPPSESPGSQFELLTIFGGYSALTITDRRLIGAVTEGKSAVGSIDRTHWVVFSLPLTDIWTLDLVRSKSAFGGLKDKEFSIQGFSPLFAINVMRIAGRMSKGRTKAAPREVMAEICGAACAARLREPIDADERARIERTLAGDWDDQGTKVVAWLLPND